MAQYPNMYNVELTKGPAVVQLAQMFLGDALANRIGAIVTENGEAVTLGGSCAGSVVLANGGTVAVSGTVSGNQCYIDLPSAVYTVEGPVEVYVSVTNSGTTTTLVAAFGNVRRKETGTVIDPGTIIPSVSALIAAIDSAVASIPADYTALLAAVSPTFSSSNNYTAGRYVWNSGNLYRFTSDHAAGSWTGTDAVQVQLVNDVSDLKSDLDYGLSYTSSNEYIVTKADIQQGSLSGTGEETNSTTRIRTRFIPVRRGMLFKFDPGTTITHTIIRMYDNNKNYLSGAGWAGGNTFIVMADGYARLMFKKGESGSYAITPADYDATLIFTTAENNKLNDNAEDIKQLAENNLRDVSGLLTWEEGTIDQYGDPLTSNSNIRSSMYEASIGETFTVVAQPGYLVTGFKYDYDGTYNGRGDFGDNYYSSKTITNAYGKFRFVVKAAASNYSYFSTIQPLDAVSLYTNRYQSKGVNKIHASYTVENGSFYPDIVDVTQRLVTSEIYNIPGMKLHVDIATGYEYRVAYFKGTSKIISEFSTGSFEVLSPTNVTFEVRKTTAAKLYPQYADNIFNIYYVPAGEPNGIEFAIKPYNAIALSKPEALIAHVSKIAYDPYDLGTFYCLYYEDDTYNTESATGTLEYLVLRKFNIQNPYDVETVLEVHPGDTIGNVTFDNPSSLREPQMLVDENIHVYTIAYVEGAAKIWHILYNKATGSKSIAACTLDGGVMMSTLGDISIYDGEYYAGLGTYAEGDAGKIVKSSDLINWETVADITAPDDYPIGSGRCWECAVAFFGDNLHALTRIQGAEGLSTGMFHAVFSLDENDEWQQDSIYRIYNVSTTRPAWFTIDGELYAMLNRAARFDFVAVPHGRYNRTAASIFKLNKTTLTLEKIYDCIYQPGIHYFSIVNYFDALYMTFSTGIKKCNISQSRDTIAFVPIEAIETYNDELQIQEGGAE